ncbi:hypothetical protein PMAYCL1PPCAC_04672, partial [Pristionchus mayeri]
KSFYHLDVAKSNSVSVYHVLQHALFIASESTLPTDMIRAAVASHFLASSNLEYSNPAYLTYTIWFLKGLSGFSMSSCHLEEEVEGRYGESCRRKRKRYRRWKDHE